MKLFLSVKPLYQMTMKNIYVGLLVTTFLLSCSGKKNTSQKEIPKDTNKIDVVKDENIPENKIYQGVELDKSKYPDDLYVVMPGEINSSGYLKGGREEYKDEYMIDHDPYTWYSPNPNRNGQGAWIELVFNKEIPLEGFEIWGGSHNENYPKYGNIYKLNNRVKKGICEFSDGTSIQFELKDIDAWQWVKFDKTINTRSIRLKISEVYKGEKWDDLCIAEFLALTSDENLAYYGDEMAKPVIYLYPEEKINVNVQLDINHMNSTLDVTYPEYSETGWNVIAEPNGELTDRLTSKKYNYLFWEGTSLKQWHFDDGFVVKGTETAEFLEDKLSEMGLNSNEYNDFIVYWLPLMMKNKYNLVRFPNEEYSRNIPLNITPQPESILRVFMIFKPLDAPVPITEQKLKTFKRKGFTVVEWGGSQITDIEKSDM
jgi:hypothetical protein